MNNNNYKKYQCLFTKTNNNNQHRLYFSFVRNFLLSEYRNGEPYIENMCHNRFSTKENNIRSKKSIKSKCNALGYL